MSGMYKEYLYIYATHVLTPHCSSKYICLLNLYQLELFTALLCF
jgi:hypothetical protein